MHLFKCLPLITFLMGSLLIAEEPHEVRATIDLGSGGSKLLVAKVDTTSEKIVEILKTESYYVPFQQQLSQSQDQTFNQEVMEQGLEALQKALSLAKECGAQKVIAVATAAFRSAKNGRSYADTLELETGIKVFIIDQTLEGKLGYQAVLATLETEPPETIVWDIGGGSMQLIGKKTDGSIFIDSKNQGAVAFRNFIIGDIQHKDLKKVKTPNPLSCEDIDLALAHAGNLAEDFDSFFKESLKKETTEVVGIGNTFALCIANVLEQNPFTKEELAEVVYNFAGKEDEAFGNDPGRHVISGNAIFVLGCMEKLGISKMGYIKVNNADGAITYAPFWK